MWSLSVKFVCEGTIFESLFRTKMIRVTCENFVWWNSILTSSCLLFCLFMPFIFNFSILSFFNYYYFLFILFFIHRRVFPNEFKKDLRKVAPEEEQEDNDFPPYRPPPPPEKEEVPEKVLTLQERMSKFQNKVTSNNAPPPKVGSQLSLIDYELP